MTPEQWLALQEAALVMLGPMVQAVATVTTAGGILMAAVTLAIRISARYF